MAKQIIRNAIAAALVALGLLLASAGCAGAQTREQRTDRYLKSIIHSRRKLSAFVNRMPKGADLHVHITGAVYAESFVKWAAAASSPRLCIDSNSLTIVPETAENSCVDPARPPAREALANSELRNRSIDAWSMRHWKESGENGHDHFFRTFGKFSAAIHGHFGDMLAEVAARSARENLSYLELMLTPDNDISSGLGRNLKWTGDLPAMRDELLPQIGKAVEAGKETLDEAETKERELLNCGSAKADPGCKVAVKFIFQIGRTNPPSVAFAQMVAAMEMAKADHRLVALNLVAPEDAKSSLDNFDGQMKMLDYLHSVYPAVHITLHAGELTPAFVAEDALKSHIRDSIEIAHAERIGHGVDVMHEQDSEGLLKEMAERKILVEICLTSNDLILNVTGKNHPLHTYIKFGVPVALATDDQGVARSDIDGEYLRAIEDQTLTYSRLKQMARASLEYSFAEGASLWKSRDTFVPVDQCAKDFGAAAKQRRPLRQASAACRVFLDGSQKATLEWNLEQRFRQFESGITAKPL